MKSFGFFSSLLLRHDLNQKLFIIYGGVRIDQNPTVQRPCNLCSTNKTLLRFYSDSNYFRSFFPPANRRQRIVLINTQKIHKSAQEKKYRFTKYPIGRGDKLFLTVKPNALVSTAMLVSKGVVDTRRGNENGHWFQLLDEYTE